MQLQVQVEKTSPIQRKLTIKVPASEVASRFERGLAEVQRTAKLKGFRPGQAPISIIKQYYGEDVRHRVFHNLIDESFDTAVREQQLRAVGSPRIETPDHKTGEGAHDHTLHEDKDLTFIATVDVMPEIEVKNYTGVAVEKTKVDVADTDVEKVVENLRDSQAQLVPASSGLANADGSMGSRPARMGDHADIHFDGGIVTDTGVERQEGMKGSKVVELGSNSLIPGFEENVVGMRAGETKTFRIPFPKDYHATDLAGKESEFTVTVNDIKEKQLPALDDEFAKGMGYEGLEDLRTKARDFLTRERTDESDRQARSQLLATIVEKNPFDIPASLVEAQTRALAQDWAQELKQQGMTDQVIQGAITQELNNLRTRAESQVRASLVLESVAKKEGIEVKPADLDEEIKKIASAMKVEADKLQDYYAKTPGKKEDLEFRLRQERTIQFLLDKAKVKLVPAKEK